MLGQSCSRSKASAITLRAALGSIILLHLELAAALSPLSDWYNGTATYYGGPADNMDPYSPSYGTKDGACGYYQLDKTKWPYWSVGALTPTNFFSKQGPAKACGECFEIWCQPGSPVGDCNPNPNQRRVTIMISDVCEPCNPGGDNQIDLQALTFLKIAPWYGGRINIKYRRVDCTPPSSIKLQLLNVNGDGLWLLMTVQEVAGTGSISRVEVKGYDGDSWVGLSNNWGAAWEIANAPNYPLDIRIVNDKGQEVVAYGAIKADGSSSSQLPPNIQFTSGSAPTSGSPPVTAFAGPTQAPNGCSDPEVSAFSLDVNAQTPQASNGGIPKCNAPPPPPANPPPMLPPAVPYVLPAPLPQQPVQLPAQPLPQTAPVNPVPAGNPVPVAPLPTQQAQVNPNPGPAQPVPAVQPGLPAGAAYPAQPGSPANPVMPVAQPVQPAGPNNNPVPQPMTDTPAPVLPAAQPGQTAGGPPVANPCACADIPPDSQYTCQQQASFGKCVGNFMMGPQPQPPGGYCAATCKRCPGCASNA